MATEIYLDPSAFKELIHVKMFCIHEDCYELSLFMLQILGYLCISGLNF